MVVASASEEGVDLVAVAAFEEVRNKSSVPDDTLRNGFITSLQSQSTGAENHVPKPKEIPKITFFNSQAFQAKYLIPCISGYLKKPENPKTLDACVFFTGDDLFRKGRPKTSRWARLIPRSPTLIHRIYPLA